MMQDIWDALESTATNSDRKLIDPRANASKRDVRLWRDHIMRFLDELDAELTIGEVREALSEYDE